MNMKRMRRGHRHGGGGGGGGFRHSGSGNSGNQPLNRNHVFDSSGPDIRLRGTAQQLFEKYLQLGRDATGAGDRVAAEGYFQHAEHYFRILGAMTAAQSPALERRSRDGGEATPASASQSEGGDGGDDAHPLEAELAGEAQSLPMPRLPGSPAEEPATER